MASFWRQMDDRMYFSVRLTFSCCSSPCIFNSLPEMSVSLKFFTDAVPSVSFGGFYNKQWFADIWPKYLLSLPQKAQSTALLELYPVVVACLLWGMVWCRKFFLVVSDNEAIVNIISKGRISMTFINRFIRRLTCTSVMCNLAGVGVSLCLCVCVCV